MKGRLKKPRLAIIAGLYYLPAMPMMTIPLPDEDISFLRAWSETDGTFAEAFLAQQARNLRKTAAIPGGCGQRHYFAGNRR